ncbi:MAG: GNAT family N-acetyltransferase [Candidatus Cloacimonetes bacterium]|jgi:predicted GNAT family N-acyltransferase|nr:GNAT family N-acetyltransferase [Candidatus Cloacimonadota bacterium]MBT6993958.1 GNAT family N-acetyltransferase [Candidatus Cloacimonadota bacterium]MBT7469766.1 GNAT family N-acetyltransferase [Candidatus Cloacimonadota bacterium]
MNFKEIIFGSQDYQSAVKLRDDILRKPLNMQFEIANLAKEKHDFHLACFEEHTIIAVLFLTKIDENTIRMRQVAVNENWQNRKVGTQLVKFAESFSKERGFSKMILHSRKIALKFYQRLSYNIIGNEFLEINIPHFKMEKHI